MRNQLGLRLITKERILTSLILFLSTFVFLFSFLIQPAQAGLGFSPGTLFIEAIQPNTNVSQHITFSRDNAQLPLTLNITLSGEATPYITAPNEVYFAPGQTESEFLFTVNSGSLPEGTYGSLVSAVTKQGVPEASAGRGSSSAIILAAYPRIKFSVSNESKPEFTVSNAQINSSEEHQPIAVTYLLTNSGNVASRPSRIELKVVNVANPTDIYTEVINSEDIPFSDPFVATTVNVPTKVELAVGNYSVDFHFYGEGGLIYEQFGYPFQVFPSGTFGQEGKLESFLTDKLSFEENELIQFNAVFNNTGRIASSASLIVEFYLDDRRLDLVKTESVFVPPGKSANFSIDKRFSEGGTYIAKAYINYGIVNSDSIELEFKVGTTNSYFIISILLLFVFCIFVLLFLLSRRKKKMNAPSSFVMPVSGSPVIISPQVPVVPEESAKQPLNNLSNEQMNKQENNSNNTPN